MNNRILLLISLIAIHGCSSIPVDLHGKTVINLVSDNESPMWRDLVKRMVPGKINKYAGYKLVEYSENELPYTMRIKILNEHHYFYVPQNRFQTGNAHRVEAEAILINNEDKSIIWSWSGWTTQPSEAYVVKYFSDAITKSLRKDSLLRLGGSM